MIFFSDIKILLIRKQQLMQ